MSQNDPKVKWFGREIDLRETYFVYFPEPAIRRELTKQQMAEYHKLQQMPDALKIRFTSKLNAKNPSLNPNITPMTGYDMLEFAEKWKLIPIFDIGINFYKEKRLTLTQTEAMDFFSEHSKYLNKKL